MACHDWARAGGVLTRTNSMYLSATQRHPPYESCGFRDEATAAALPVATGSTWTICDGVAVRLAECASSDARHARLRWARGLGKEEWHGKKDVSRRMLGVIMARPHRQLATGGPTAP
jgi:hypothetical protein